MLGYFAEGQGEHHVSLEWIEQFDNECDHDEATLPTVRWVKQRNVNIGQWLEIDQSDDDQHDTDQNEHTSQIRSHASV